MIGQCADGVTQGVLFLATGLRQNWQISKRANVQVIQYKGFNFWANGSD